MVGMGSALGGGSAVEALCAQLAAGAGLVSFQSSLVRAILPILEITDLMRFGDLASIIGR